MMHGLPRLPWTKLAETADVGNTTLVLQEATDWMPGDHIFVSSTELEQLEAEECFIRTVSDGGRVIEITKPLLYRHWGAGWTSADGQTNIHHYRASVGLLSRNVIVQGDDKFTQAQQVASLFFK